MNERRRTALALMVVLAVFAAALVARLVVAVELREQVAAHAADVAAGSAPAPTRTQPVMTIPHAAARADLPAAVQMSDHEHRRQQPHQSGRDEIGAQPRQHRIMISAAMRDQHPRAIRQARCVGR